MIVDILTAIATLIGAFAAVAAVAVAYRQLKNLNDTLRMNGLMAVLQMESHMKQCKRGVDDVAAQIKREQAKESPDVKVIELLGEQMDGYLEDWLNASDRLAYCIVRQYLPERDWRSEYRTYFHDLVRDHEAKFRADSPYNNLLDLNRKWQRE